MPDDTWIVTFRFFLFATSVLAVLLRYKSFLLPSFWIDIHDGLYGIASSSSRIRKGLIPEVCSVKRKLCLRKGNVRMTVDGLVRMSMNRLTVNTRYAPAIYSQERRERTDRGDNNVTSFRYNGEPCKLDTVLYFRYYAPPGAHTTVNRDWFVSGYQEFCTSLLNRRLHRRLMADKVSLSLRILQ